MARGLPAPGKGGEGAWREGGTHPRSDHRGSRSPPRGAAGAARRPACRGGLGWGWGLPAPHLTSPHRTAQRGLSAPPPGCEGREREGRRRVTVTPTVTPPHPSPAQAGGERSALPGQPRGTAPPRRHLLRRQPALLPPFPEPPFCQLPAETSCSAPATEESAFPPSAGRPPARHGSLLCGGAPRIPAAVGGRRGTAATPLRSAGTSVVAPCMPSTLGKSFHLAWIKKDAC